MRELPNISGPVGYGETYCENRSSGQSASENKEFYQELILKANSVSLLKVFKHYKLGITEFNNKIICPLKSHKNGRERTGSFQYYPDSNSYYCHGCKSGTRVCNFVADMDGLKKIQAAAKILKLFKDDVGSDDNYISSQDLAEKLNITVGFSNTVRQFRETYSSSNDEKFIEGICLVYDNLHEKHSSKSKMLDNSALAKIVERLQEQINFYKSCQL